MKWLKRATKRLQKQQEECKLDKITIQLQEMPQQLDKFRRLIDKLPCEITYQFSNIFDVPMCPLAMILMFEDGVEIAGSQRAGKDWLYVNGEYRHELWNINRFQEDLEAFLAPIYSGIKRRSEFLQERIECDRLELEALEIAEQQQTDEERVGEEGGNE